MGEGEGNQAAVAGTLFAEPTLSLARAASSSLRSAFQTRSRASRSAIIFRRLALAPACRAARAAFALYMQTHYNSRPACLSSTVRLYSAYASEEGETSLHSSSGTTGVQRLHVTAK